MNVYLGPELDRFVGRMLKTGTYQSQSEVLREALRLLKQQEELRAAELEMLRAQVRRGMKDIANGGYTEVDATTLQKIRDRGRRRLARQRKAG